MDNDWSQFKPLVATYSHAVTYDAAVSSVVADAFQQMRRAIALDLMGLCPKCGKMRRSTR